MLSSYSSFSIHCTDEVLEWLRGSFGADVLQDTLAEDRL